MPLKVTPLPYTHIKSPAYIHVTTSPHIRVYVHHGPSKPRSKPTNSPSLPSTLSLHLWRRHTPGARLASSGMHVGTGGGDQGFRPLMTRTLNAFLPNHKFSPVIRNFNMSSSNMLLSDIHGKQELYLINDLSSFSYCRLSMSNAGQNVRTL